MIGMLKTIMDLGVMVEPEAAEFLKDEKLAIIVAEKLKAMKERPFVLGKAEAMKLCSTLRTLKEFKPPTAYSMQDMVGLHSNRYRALQKILLGKPEFKNVVSIKNAKGQTTIIGVKRDEYAEDLTGRIRLITSANLLDEDVIGVLGFASADGVTADRIIFPEIGLKAVATAPVKLVIGSDVPLDHTALYECCGVKILVLSTDCGAIGQKLGIEEKDVPLELLKRRHLNSPPNDVIEDVPDVFIATMDWHFVQNYKGTTIIGAQKGKPIEIDLQTRETKSK